MTAKTIREQLEEAYDEAEAEVEAEDEDVSAKADDEEGGGDQDAEKKSKQPEKADEQEDAPSEDEAAAADAGEEEPAEEAIEDEEPAEEPAEEPEEEAETFEPPEHWRAEDKEMFNSIEPEAQEFLLKRHREMEGDYTRRMQEFRPVQKVIDSYASRFAAYGVSPEQGIARLLEYENVLANGAPEQKQQAILKLIDDYGVPKSNFIATGDEDDDIFSDPSVRQLKDEVEGLKNFIRQQSMGQAQQTQQQADRQVTEFIDAKDENGQPLYPFAEELLPVMIDLAHAAAAQGRETNIKELYDNAIWLDPNTRQKVMAAQAEQGSANQNRAKATKAKQAKKAGSSVKDSGSASESNPDDELSKLPRRDMISKLYDANESERI